MTAQYNWESSNAVILDGSRESERLAALDAACLDENGLLKAMPASFYAAHSADLSLWCVRRGFYCLPTLELVEFIRDQIASEESLEIGSGNGALGRAVGIPMTDSRLQERDDVKAIYDTLAQALVPYGPDVEKLTALEAIAKYQPRAVLAAWVTHRFDRNRPALMGNMYGVDESRMWSKKFIKRYIFIGHERIHGLKPLLTVRHETHRLPYLYSRALDRQDVVWVWKR